MAKETIIIKRITKAGHGGGHGGAWKVAYADFVTAMMCFFLVMWLMGSDEETKAAVSSYFNNPNPTSPWRPELKDNENIPLGNKTGSGDSVLKGSEVSLQIVKEPMPVVLRNQKINADAHRILKETLSSADAISFSISEDDLFESRNTDVLIPNNALKHLSIVEKIALLFKGSLKIRGLPYPGTAENYELRIRRLIAVQRFIVEHQWMEEDSIKTTLRKETSGSPDSDRNQKIELTFIH